MQQARKIFEGLTSSSLFSEITHRTEKEGRCPQVPNFQPQEYYYQVSFLPSLAELGLQWSMDSEGIETRLSLRAESDSKPPRELESVSRTANGNLTESAVSLNFDEDNGSASGAGGCVCSARIGILSIQIQSLSCSRYSPPVPTSSPRQ